MSITPDLTTISLCDVDDWDGGVGGLDIEGQVQGTGCLSITYPGAGLRAENFETISTVNMTDGGSSPLGYPVIYGWLSFPALRNVSTKRKGGLRFLIRDTAGVKGQWFVGGNNTMATSGWYPYCVRTNQPFDVSSPTFRARAGNVATLTTDPIHELAVNDVVNISSVGGTGYNGQYTVASLPTTTTFTYVNTGTDEGTTPDITGVIQKVSPVPNLTIVNGVGWKVCLDVKGIVKWDAFRYGKGLIVWGGSAGSPETFSTIWAAEDNSDNKYGVVVKSEGVYFAQGKLYFGSTTELSNTYFKDTSQVIVFMDKMVGSDFYEIVFQGKSGQTTEVYFGDPTTEVSGLFVKSAGAVRYKLTATDANLTKMGLYGCSFVNADTITLPTNNAYKNVKACNFEACAKLVASTCVVNGCKFISAPADAVLISNDPHYVTSCNFINCLRGVELNTVGDGEYGFNALIFTGTTYHVNNTSGSTLTVANGNGSNASTYTGTLVNFTSSVPLTVTVVDKDNKPIANAQTAIYKTSDLVNALLNTDTRTINAGSFVVGTRYKITFVGTTDFTLIGASSNTVGVAFTCANGVGSGTGTATDGVATVAYTAGGTPFDIVVRIRKSSTGDTKYYTASTTGTVIAITGYSVKITLVVDLNA